MSAILTALKNFLALARRDIDAAMERDPAARSRFEVATSYPGVHAVWAHRIAHGLHVRGFKLVARWISQFSRFLTGIEIHPGATIGPGFFIDHGMGVVIGETAEVGEDVTLYQGVPLGGTGKQHGKRHPTIHDGVVVGTGAQVLGSFDVGQGAKIGAGAIVVKNVPPNSTVVGNPGRAVVVDGQRVDPDELHHPKLEHSRLPDPIAEAFKRLVERVAELEDDIANLEAGRPCEHRHNGHHASIESEVSDLLGLNGGGGI